MVIFSLAVCVLCYTGQSFFNRLFTDRYQGPAGAATPVFSMCYGIIAAALTFLLNGCTMRPSQLTFLLGCLTGIILFLYNLGMINAAQRGPYSFQSIAMIFGGIVVAMIFSRILWGDQISLLQFVGIGIMLAAFIVINLNGLNSGSLKKGYYFWALSLFVTNGVYGVLMDTQQRLVGSERNEMIFVTFLSSAVFSAIYLLATQKQNSFRAFPSDVKIRMCILASSVCAVFAIRLLLLLLHDIPSYVLYTIINGSVLAVSAVLCRVVLKEKISKNMCTGILLSIVSITLLSLSGS